MKKNIKITACLKWIKKFKSVAWNHQTFNILEEFIFISVCILRNSIHSAHNLPMLVVGSWCHLLAKHSNFHKVYKPVYFNVYIFCCTGGALPLAVHLPPREPLPLPLWEERGRGRPSRGQGRIPKHTTHPLEKYDDILYQKSSFLLYIFCAFSTELERKSINDIQKNNAIQNMI